MKRMKFFLALLLSFVLLISSSLGALAEGTDGEGDGGGSGGSSTSSPVITYENVTDKTFTVTITANTDDHGIHSYEAYQIFTGTLAKELHDGEFNNYVLSDIVWGSGITDEGITALLEDRGTKPYDYAKYLETLLSADKADELKAEAAIIGSYLKKGVTEGEYKDGKITGLAPGYYLIQDALDSPDDSADANKPASKTKFILQVVADQTVEVKSSVPTVEKKVKEKNDTTGKETGWQDAADYDIGDHIPYKITATIGKGIEHFDGYSLEFYDELSAGLKLDDGWKITIILPGASEGEDGPSYDVTAAFTKGTGAPTAAEPEVPETPDQPEEAAPASEGGEDGGETGGETGGESANTATIHNWKIADLKAIKVDANGKVVTGEGEGTLINIVEGTKIVLEYTAELTEDAKIGSEGNPNTTYLRFDNDPNHCGEGKPEGETPKDKVTVFTYRLVVYKVTEAGDDAITEEAYNALTDTQKADYVKLQLDDNGPATYLKVRALEGAGFTLYKKYPPENAGTGDAEAPTEPAEPTEAEPTEQQNPAQETEPTNDADNEPAQGEATPTEGVAGDDNQGTVNEGGDGEPAGTGEDNTTGTPEPAENWVQVGAEVIGAGVTTFTFNGVDAGVYKLVESTVPAGYNKVDDIIITVTATYTETADDPKLLSLEVEPDYFHVDVVETTNSEGKVTEIITDGIIEGKILNLKGAVLPGTGSIGTTPFYVVGGVLVIGAAAMLVMKRRRKEEE